MKRENAVKLIVDSVKGPIIFIDIGARNGILDLKELAPKIDAYGFEPNPVEYEKLINGKTDLLIQVGLDSPKYNKLTYSPYAIYDRYGSAQLHITKGPGACCLLKPNYERLREIKSIGARKFKESFGDDIFKVTEMADVEVRTLDWFCEKNGLSYCDYLKIDAEGVEYEILSGAPNILKNTGVIKVEVCFIPLREKQKLFSDVDLFLRSQGFDLLAFECSPIMIGYKEREKSIDFGYYFGFADRFGQQLSADAIYVNRNLGQKERLLSQAAILVQKNYLDEALFILKRKTDFKHKDVLQWLHNYEMYWGYSKTGNSGRIVVLTGWKKRLFDMARSIWWAISGKGPVEPQYQP